MQQYIHMNDLCMCVSLCVQEAREDELMKEKRKLTKEVVLITNYE